MSHEHFPDEHYLAGVAGAVVLAGPPRDPAPVDEWLTHLDLSREFQKKLRAWLAYQPYPTLPMYTAVWQVWEQLNERPVNIIVPAAAGPLARRMIRHHRFWAGWESQKYHRPAQSGPHPPSPIERYQAITAELAKDKRQVGADTFYRWSVVVNAWNHYHQLEAHPPMMPFAVDAATETLMIPRHRIQASTYDAATDAWTFVVGPEIPPKEG